LVQTLAKTKLNWVQGDNNRNHKVSWVEVTNEAGQTRRTSYAYDVYNNPVEVKEHDFAPEGTAGTELRKTVTTYVHQTTEEYKARRLLHLPSSVKVIANGVVVAQTDYEYDNGSADVRNYLTNRTDLIMFDSSYNPFVVPPTEEICEYDYDPPRPPQQFCIPANLQKHGNLTKVTVYANAQSNPPTGAETQNFNYDVAGNLVKASATCCNQKEWTYNKTYEYAFPVEEKQGNPVLLTTGATYDFNTGLIKTATDENNQTTTVTYEAATLRQTRVDRPDGGYTTLEYNDTLVANPDSSHLCSFIKTTTALDSSRTVSAWTYFDGRGATVRQFGALTSQGHVGVTDIEYDEMGRVKRTSNPYYASGATAPINPSGKWTTVTYDKLGRAIEIELPDLTKIQSSYNGTTTTVTDQALRQRRQLTDALGRVIRVDEPDANGNLDSGGVPVQPTYYEYDSLDNLTKVTQTQGSVTQERLFKCDSLSRLTHERQVEAVATLNDAGVKQTSGGSWTGVYVYNSNGLLVDGYDARGVKTTFIYDNLYRVSQVSFTGETNNVTPNVTYY
jgi:YD repeat-containing protein